MVSHRFTVVGNVKKKIYLRFCKNADIKGLHKPQLAVGGAETPAWDQLC